MAGRSRHTRSPRESENRVDAGESGGFEPIVSSQTTLGTDEPGRGRAGTEPCGSRGFSDPAPSGARCGFVPFSPQTRHGGGR